jgi:hypothetical protein
MINRFQLRLYPELKHVNGFLPRQRLIWRSSDRSIRNHRVWIAFVLILIGAISLPSLLWTLGLGWFLDFSWASFVYGALWGSVIAYFQNSAMRREMRIELRHQGVPICVNCGYDITGIEVLTCPECGSPIIDPVGA